jgi:hypothetical protein
MAKASDHQIAHEGEYELGGPFEASSSWDYPVECFGGPDLGSLAGATSAIASMEVKVERPTEPTSGGDDDETADFVMIESRRHEPGMTHDEVKAKLRANGLLQD